MGRKQGPMDPLAREAFLAALEYGVSPLLNPSYGPLRGRELHTMSPIKVQVVRIKSPRTRPARKTRGGIVTAADIMANRGMVLE